MGEDPVGPSLEEDHTHLTCTTSSHLHDPAASLSQKPPRFENRQPLRISQMATPTTPDGVDQIATAGHEADDGKNANVGKHVILFSFLQSMAAYKLHLPTSLLAY